jgi:hypothetical protein
VSLALHDEKACKHETEWARGEQHGARPPSHKKRTGRELYSTSNHALMIVATSMAPALSPWQGAEGTPRFTSLLMTSS